jgi:hypothetical protein
LLRVGKAARKDDGGSCHSGQKFSGFHLDHGSLLEVFPPRWNSTTPKSGSGVRIVSAFHTEFWNGEFWT